MYRRQEYVTIMKNQVKLAESIAREAHEGQFRKFGDDKDKPYIVHPERVANSFSEPILSAAGWLHDVIEDTNITPEDLISRGIDKDIVEIVKLLTKQEGDTYDIFIERLSSNWRYSRLAMKVKVADLKDNLSSCPHGQMRDKYLMALKFLELKIKLREMEPIFYLDDKESEELDEWYKKHNKKCPHRKGEGLGAIGGRFTYSFTPTGLGDCKSIKCACGEEVHVTNTEDW